MSLKQSSVRSFRENSVSSVFSFRLFFRAPTHPRPPCSRVETHKRRRRRVTARSPCSASVASARRSTSSASRARTCDGSLIGAATRFKPHPHPVRKKCRWFPNSDFRLGFGDRRLWGGTRRCRPIANEIEDTRQKEQRAGCCCYGNAQAFQKGKSRCSSDCWFAVISFTVVVSTYRDVDCCYTVSL